MNQLKPRLSIVVPTYNQGPYIAECLNSIQAQTYQNWEVIIQDSNSTDETEKICRKFSGMDSRFIYRREKDHGQSDAINRGLKLSRGFAWTWICSDDFYLSMKCLSELMERLEGIHRVDSKCVGVYGTAAYVSENGKRLDGYTQRRRNIFKDDFKLTWPLSQPSSLMIADAVRNAGGVDESLHLGMDLDLFCRVLRPEHYLAFVDTEVAAVRVQPNSKSVALRVNTAKTALTLVKKHFGNSGPFFKSAYFLELLIGQGIAVDAKLERSSLGFVFTWLYRKTGKFAYRAYSRFIHQTPS